MVKTKAGKMGMVYAAWKDMRGKGIKKDIMQNITRGPKQNKENSSLLYNMRHRSIVTSFV
jgi:hypothetical protein